MNATDLTKHRPTFTETEIDACLTACALESGNGRRAAQQLAGIGIDVAMETLYRWMREDKTERYRQIQESVAPELHARLAEQHDDLVQGYSEIQRQAIGIVLEHLPEMDGLQAGRAAKDAAVGAGINTEKALLRRGQPTQITRSESASDVLRALVERFPDIVSVDAEELEVSSAPDDCPYCAPDEKCALHNETSAP